MRLDTKLLLRFLALALAAMLRGAASGYVNTAAAWPQASSRVIE